MPPQSVVLRSPALGGGFLLLVNVSFGSFLVIRYLTMSIRSQEYVLRLQGPLEIAVQGYSEPRVRIFCCYHANLRYAVGIHQSSSDDGLYLAFLEFSGTDSLLRSAGVRPSAPREIRN